MTIDEQVGSLIAVSVETNRLAALYRRSEPLLLVGTHAGQPVYTDESRPAGWMVSDPGEA